MAESVTRYIRATASVYFPADSVNCESCHFMRAEVLTGRKYCSRSGELLHHTQHQIGYDCPLHFETEEENGIEIQAFGSQGN